MLSKRCCYNLSGRQEAHAGPGVRRKDGGPRDFVEASWGGVAPGGEDSGTTRFAGGSRTRRPSGRRIKVCQAWLSLRFGSPQRLAGNGPRWLRTVSESRGMAAPAGGPMELVIPAEWRRTLEGSSRVPQCWLTGVDSRHRPVLSVCGRQVSPEMLGKGRGLPLPLK